MEGELTVQILKDIRQELRSTREELREELRSTRDEMRAANERQDQRFEAVESTLRDLSEQMVMHSRALRSLLDKRSTSDERFDDLERRVSALEAGRSPG